MSKRKRSHAVIQRISAKKCISLSDLAEAQVTIETHPALTLKSYIRAADPTALERYLSTGTGCSLQYVMDGCDDDHNNALSRAMALHTGSVVNLKIGLMINECFHEPVCVGRVPLSPIHSSSLTTLHVSMLLHPCDYLMFSDCCPNITTLHVVSIRAYQLVRFKSLRSIWVDSEDHLVANSSELLGVISENGAFKSIRLYNGNYGILPVHEEHIESVISNCMHNSPKLLSFSTALVINDPLKIIRFLPETTKTIKLSNCRSWNDLAIAEIFNRNLVHIDGISVDTQNSASLVCKFVKSIPALETLGLQLRCVDPVDVITQLVSAAPRTLKRLDIRLRLSNEINCYHVVVTVLRKQPRLQLNIFDESGGTYMNAIVVVSRTHLANRKRERLNWARICVLSAAMRCDPKIGRSIIPVIRSILHLSKISKV